MLWNGVRSTPISDYTWLCHKSHFVRNGRSTLNLKRRGRSDPLRARHFGQRFREGVRLEWSVANARPALWCVFCLRHFVTRACLHDFFLRLCITNPLLTRELTAALSSMPLP